LRENRRKEGEKGEKEKKENRGNGEEVKRER
jgi:hypothetical protein